MQELFFVGVFVVLGLFLAFLMIKESESRARFLRYEKALEALMQEISR